MRLTEIKQILPARYTHKLCVCVCVCYVRMCAYLCVGLNDYARHNAQTVRRCVLVVRPTQSVTRAMNWLAV